MIVIYNEFSLDKYDDKLFSFRYNDYNYYVEFDAVLSNGRVVKLSDHIKMLTTVHLYDDFVFPIVKATLLVNKNLYNQLNDNIDNLVWRLSINRVHADPSEHNKVYGFPEVCIKNVKLRSIDFNRSLFGHHRTDRMGYSHNNEEELVLELVADDHYRINRGRLTGVFKNVDLQNMIAQMYAECLPRGELLIHEPDNTKLYPELVLNGKNLPNTIKQFQQYYGIYESGLRIFFDFDDYFCLPMDLLKSHVKKEKWDFENVFVFVQDSFVNRSIDLSGSYVDWKNKRYVALADNINAIATVDDSNREVFGENIETFEYRYDGSKFVESSKGNDAGVTNITTHKTNTTGVKENRYFKKFDNDYALSSKVYQSMRDNLQVILLFRNIDDSIIKMNKKFFIQFRNGDLNRDYRGTYQMTGKITNYETNGHVYEYKSFIIFNRLTKDILSHS